MKNLRMPILFVALFLLRPAIAQQSSQIAYFELTAIKPGMETQFQATLKRHWAWHTKQGETWSYYVWTVESGEKIGQYRVASFGHSWKEVDASNLAVAGTPGPEADPEPFKSSSQASYFVFRPDLSFGDWSPMPAPLSSFLEISVKPESLREFQDALRGLYPVLQQSRPGAKPSIRCYELVSGGEWPLFVLIEDRADWAAFEKEGLLDTLSRATQPSRNHQPHADALLRSVRSVHIEALQFHEDLSRIVHPASK